MPSASMSFLGTAIGRPARLSGVLILLAMTAGCSLPGSEDPVVSTSTTSGSAALQDSVQETPQPSTPAGDAVSEAPNAEQEPATDNEALQQAVLDALTDLAVASPQPSREQLRDALVALGIAEDRIEISASTTPTGLGADAIQAGVLGDDGCVMAYIRDGDVSTAELPVLANGQCFLGSDRG